MKPLVFIVFCLLCVSVKAQTSIKLDEVSKHIGDSVTVCGKVSDMRYFENSNKQPTFLNMGDKYPNQQLTVVIWGETRKLFAGKVDDMKGKDICITGRIILYKEKPEIVIEKTEQIVVQ
jgi:DNA/RNA endonuclease YhcR with UshA esterase domain